MEHTLSIKCKCNFLKLKFAFFLRLIDSSSFKWTDMIYLITQLSIVTTVLLSSSLLRLWSSFSSSWVFFRTFPLYLCDPRKCILIRDGAKWRKNHLDNSPVRFASEVILNFNDISMYPGKNFRLCPTPSSPPRYWNRGQGEVYGDRIKSSRGG